MEEKVNPATVPFYDEIDWEKVAYNKISKEDYLKLKSRHKRCYVTFLGSQDQMQFYMFRALSWPEFKDIRLKGLDKDSTHDYILNACLIWPKADPLALNSIEAGVVLTLVHQILAVSYFLNDPNKALEMILEV